MILRPWCSSMLLCLLVAGCASQAPSDPVAETGPYATLGTREQVLAAAARQQALDSLASGRTLEWRSPDGGAEGKITPTRSFRADGGSYCREFTEEVNAAGRTDRFTDLRCRTDAGRWLRPKA